MSELVLVTGGEGQLGKALLAALATRGVPCVGVDQRDFDITDALAVKAAISRHRPDTVIHCAAYTAVDLAEDHPEDCTQVNVQGTQNVAQVCQDCGAALVYISTDYVFGDNGSEPMDVDALRNPCNVYGKTKMLGENIVAETVERFHIVRSSWLFGTGGENFITKVLDQLEETGEVAVVEDQIGSPTYAADLAVLLCDLVNGGLPGFYHATNEGFCSFADMAEEVVRLTNIQAVVRRVRTGEFPAKALRPANSRLSKRSLDAAGLKHLPPWRDAVARYLKEIGRIKR